MSAILKQKLIDIANGFTKYGLWKGGGSGGSSTLSEMTDVTFTDLQANDLLKYNGSVWVNDDNLQKQIDTLNSNLANLCTFVIGWGSDVTVENYGTIATINVTQGNWLLIGYNGSSSTCWLNGITDQNDTGYLRITTFNSFSKIVGVSANKKFFLQNISGGVVQNKGCTYLCAIRLNN